MAAEPFTFSPPPPPPPPPPSSSVDPASGFSPETLTFHSLRPSVPLPPLSLPLSFPSFAASLLPSPLPAHPALIDAVSGRSLSFQDFLSRARSLSSALSARYHLKKGDVAFILSPPSLDVPVLYFALLSLGVVLSPANPVSTPSEISRLVKLVNPSVTFAAAASSSKLPKNAGIHAILLDSPDFKSFLLNNNYNDSASAPAVNQADPAVIQFSSGTTGRVKAAALPHRSFIAMTAGFHALKPVNSKPEVTLLVAPMFHSLGFFFVLKGIAMGETTVVMSKVGLEDILGAAERFGATMMTAAPPVVVAMGRVEVVGRYDLGALERVMSGGAPLSAEAAERFAERFPRVELRQGYGSTEAGGISRMINRQECRHLKSAGRLTENVEAKIVDIVTGKALPVGEKGELWVRGPAVMIGYVGDDEANASTFDSKGWLKTGDLCYFDNDGFLYLVDRLKELIKYKAYQVPPAELEHLLHTLPDIADAAVIPFPQEEVGQIPLAFIVRKKGSRISERQVMDYVAKQVAPYKKIRKVVFVNSIPKSAAGKILRRELASHALCIDAPVSRL